MELFFNSQFQVLLYILLSFLHTEKENYVPRVLSVVGLLIDNNRSDSGLYVVNMKCVVITGSNGFIGKHLSNKLIEKGYKVVGLPRELLYDLNALTAFIKKINPSEIYHLAAYGNKYDQKENDLIIKANILGTFNLLEATKEIDYKAFINTGSSSEYGKKDKPMNEDDPLEPNTIYGVSKVAATTIARFFAVNYKKPVVTVRPFSVYGPNDDSHHFIPTVIRCFETGEVLNLAPGVHDWIYINDFIEGVIIAARNAEKIAGKAINIGTGVQSTNDEVVERLQEIMKVSGNINRVDNLRSYDTNIMWQADNSLLKELGWRSKYNLKQGLERTISESKKP